MTGRDGGRRRGGRGATRALPERSRLAPSRYGDFSAPDFVVEHARRRPSSVVPVLLRHVASQELIPVAHDSLVPEASFPPILLTDYTGINLPHPKRYAFGRRLDGTYAGFYDENSQVFRCGSETAYWAIISGGGRGSVDANGLRRQGAWMNGEHWTLVSLKEVLVAGGASSRVNPDCVVGYWCNGPMEVHYQVQRYHGQIPSDLLRPDVWTYMDGWDETISSCAIRYAAHVSVYATGMTLASPDHVAMRGVGLLELSEDPEVELQLKLETSIVLPRISTSFKRHLRAGGLELDPPSLCCLLWDKAVSTDEGTYLPFPPFPLTCVPTSLALIAY